MLRAKKMKLYKIFIFLILLTIFISFHFDWFNISFSEPKKEDQNYVFYTQAVNLAVADIDRALDMCSRSGDMADECFTSIVMVIAEKDSERSLDICRGIVDLEWRGECFFIVAESLFGKNVSLASEVCEKSEVFQHECYFHLGRFTKTPSNTINQGILACGIVPSEFRGECFGGLGEDSVGLQFEDVSSVISACNEILFDSRDDCFFSLGDAFFYGWFPDGGDVSRGVLACDTVPSEFKGNCFKGLANGITRFFFNDLSASISACNKFPLEFRNDCLKSVEKNK